MADGATVGDLGSSASSAPCDLTSGRPTSCSARATTPPSWRRHDNAAWWPPRTCSSRGRRFRRDWSAPTTSAARPPRRTWPTSWPWARGPTALLVGARAPPTCPPTGPPGSPTASRRCALVGATVVGATSSTQRRRGRGRDRSRRPRGRDDPVTARRARPATVLAVAGRLELVGRQGSRCWAAGSASPRVLADAHRVPRSRRTPPTRRRRRAGATTMLDVSDGLVQGRQSPRAGVRRSSSPSRPLPWWWTDPVSPGGRGVQRGPAGLGPHRRGPRAPRGVPARHAAAEASRGSARCGRRRHRARRRRHPVRRPGRPRPLPAPDRGPRRGAELRPGATRGRGRGHLVAGAEAAAAPELDLAVDLDLAGLQQGLGLAAGVDRPGVLERLPRAGCLGADLDLDHASAVSLVVRHRVRRTPSTGELDGPGNATGPASPVGAVLGGCVSDADDRRP